MRDKIKEIIKMVMPLMIIGISLLGTFMYFQKKTILPMENEEHLESAIRDNASVIEFENPGDALSQKIENIDDRRKLYGVSLRFGTFNTRGTGKVAIFIKSDQGEIVNEVIDIGLLQDNAEYKVHFKDPINTNSLTVTLQLENISDNSRLAVYTNTGDNHQIDKLTYNGMERDARVGIKYVIKDFGGLQWLARIIFSVIFILVCLLYIWLFILKKDWQKIVIPIVMIMGIIYILLLTPGSIPDEGAHFATTYVRSSTILGHEEVSGDIVLMREEDSNLVLSDRVDQKGYYDLKNDLGKRTNKTDIIKSQYKSEIQAPFFEHLPAALGVATARLLNLNGITLFYLGRLFNLVFFSISIWYAIKKMPFGKLAVLIIALFPMTLQEGASYSYDAIVIGIAFMFSAYCINLCKRANSEITLKDIIIVAVLGFFLAGCKSGAYLPVCFMILLVPIDKDVDKKKYIKYIGVVMVAVIVGYCIFAMSGSLKNLGVSAESTGKIVSNRYTVGWVFANLKQFIYMLFNTFFLKIDFYYESLIGYNLGYFAIPTYIIVTVIFTVLLLISFIDSENEQWELTKGKRCILALLILLSVGLIEASMLLGWTTTDLDFIEGVQGRYFLPLMLAVFLTVKNHNITIKKKIDNPMIVVACSIHIMTAMSIMEIACN